jgi:uncharacterized protein
MLFAELAGAGLGIGFIVGLTGTGAATLIMAALAMGIGLPATSAVGTTITAAAIMKLAGSIEHARRGTVVWKVVRDFAMGSLPGALIAGVLTHLALTAYGDNADIWLRRVIGAVIILAAILIVRRGLTSRERTAAQAEGKERHNSVLLAILGSLAGFVVAATSVGAGTFTKGMLVFSTRLDARRLVGTDLMHGAILAFVAAGVHVAIGSVEWTAVASISLGAIPGAVVGGKLAARAPVRILQIAVAVALVIIGIRMLAG